MAERLSEACRPRVLTQPGAETDTLSRRQRAAFQSRLGTGKIAVGAWINSTTSERESCRSTWRAAVKRLAGAWPMISTGLACDQVEGGSSSSRASVGADRAAGYRHGKRAHWSPWLRDCRHCSGWPFARAGVDARKPGLTPRRTTGKDLVQIQGRRN